MDSLFDMTPTNTYEPLPVRMRPTKLDHLYGQEKAVGKGTFLRAMVEKDTIPSMLFYGPCGTGKTTLAGIIAKVSNSYFVNLNATNAGIGELRTIIEDARKRVRSLQQRTILFLDEIHRFNKSQQDVLLPCVEDGTIILIGATTENPFFEVNRPLLSRLRLITLEALTPKAIGQILRRAITDEEVGLGKRHLQVTDEVLEDVGIFVNGDGRMALNILEQAAAMVPDEGTITIEVLEKDEIKFTPENKKNVLMEYLKNIRDWNISRQIPWGIPIPAFQNIEDPTDWIFDERVHESQIEVNGKTYKRDEDTLDTWFSSGQWPFITTDFLEGGELSKFYPNSVMETGHDLIFPWISRMIMLGIYCTGQIPFREVYLHGMVLDEHGQKMSKSKGNVINPMDVIAEYGSDAFRLGIIASRSAGQNQAFSKNKVIAGRNFCNKLWNISRFISEKVGEIKSTKQPEAFTPVDHWIVRELDKAIAEIESHMQNYRFAEASETVYHTIWSTVADWYIEASKTQDNPELLAWVLETCLKIAHPFAPFVTETIWQTLPWTEGILANEKLAESLKFNEFEALQFERIQDLVGEIRLITAELPGKKRYNLVFEKDELIAKNAETIRHLSRVPEIVQTDAPHGFSLAASGLGAYLDVPTSVLAEYKTELNERIEKISNEIDLLEKRLSNENYVSKAPAHLVEETREEFSNKKAELEKVKKAFEIL